MFQMMGVFAEFERSMIQERVRAGLARAKAEGKILGRPRLDALTEHKVHKMLEDGVGMLRIADKLKVSSGTVQRIAREMRPGRAQ
jgi:DNA invertase Pin-like site-specific DNA recombinase